MPRWITAAVLAQMQRLNAHTDAMRPALDGEQADAVQAGAGAVGAVADAQVAVWTAIAREARAIQQLAEGRSVRATAGHYAALRAKCVGCHAKSVTDGRPVLDPPAWE